MEGKLVLVTGASRGLGHALAKQLARTGNHVIIASRTLADAVKIHDEIVRDGGKASAIELVVGDSCSATRAAAFVEMEFGHLDVLVNNAGVMLSSSWSGNDAETCTQEVLRATFDVNFFGAVQLTQAFLPSLRKSKSSLVVNVSSVMASNTLHAMPDGPLKDIKSLAYDASKAALNTFTTHLAALCLEAGPKVVSVHPGWLRTDLGTEAAPEPVEGGATRLANLIADLDQVKTGMFIGPQGGLPW